MADGSQPDSQERFPWQLGVFDAHCHPTDTMDSVDSIPKMKARVLTIMATRAEDQELIAQTADRIGIESPDESLWNDSAQVLPSFGWHPWFSHQMFLSEAFGNKRTLGAEEKVKHYRGSLTPQPEDEDFLLRLPDPRPFSVFLDQTRDFLRRYPLALVGEIGLDKSFRIPEAWLPEHQERRDGTLTPGGREGRRLSPFRVDMDHQKKILRAQLQLAGELQRPVSIHGVQAHGIVFETLKESWKGYERRIPSRKERKQRAGNRGELVPNESSSEELDASFNGYKPFPPRICLHSYSGPAEAIKPYLDPSIPAEIFFSFSSVINFSTAASTKAEAVIKTLPDDRILTESDLHTAGTRMDEQLEDIVRKICRIKGWSLHQGVKQLGENWRRFAFART